MAPPQQPGSAPKPKMRLRPGLDKLARGVKPGGEIALRRPLARPRRHATYMLAVVVDDHDTDVTHIIRGDEHLTNAARQKQIYDALG